MVTTTLKNSEGIKISKNLSLHDLFSFDVLEEDSSRYNFEKLFHDYETRIKINTESLLSKIVTSETDIKSEIINIFRFKILNFVRNPYSIEKILNTFCDLKSIIPNDPIHFESFNRVLEGSKPQQSYLCSQLGIKESEYREWLAMIFLLLVSVREDQPNLLDRFIKMTYENPDRFIQVHVFTYDDETCLLSDRGYNEYETNEDMVWEFNLHSKGFIKYCFVNIDTCIPEYISEESVSYYKSGVKTINVMHMHNDLNQLEVYNQNTVAYCHEKVFNSSRKCHGVRVI